jgi:hypothetical protein
MTHIASQHAYKCWNITQWATLRSEFSEGRGDFHRLRVARRVTFGDVEAFEKGVNNFGIASNVGAKQNQGLGQGGGIG